jgi:hypothetical protein
VATLLEPDAIQVAIAIVMVVMLVLQFVRPRAVAGRPADELGVTPGLVVGFAVMGLYAGFIQAGTGVLVLLFLSLVYRVDLVSANAIKVLVNLVLTVVAIAVFAGAGETIDLPRGLALAGATGLGGVVGARAAVRRGEGFVRLLLAAAVLASAAKLLYDAF